MEKILRRIDMPYTIEMFVRSEDGGEFTRSIAAALIFAWESGLPLDDYTDCEFPLDVMDDVAEVQFESDEDKHRGVRVWTCRVCRSCHFDLVMDRPNAV